jgi:hypothetical protein
LSLTKQKSAKRFRKIGATDSNQFDAPNAKKSSANASIYPVPIIYLALFGVLFYRPPKLSLTKQKSAKRFRKIGATDSSQFDAPTAKKSSAKQFSKKHTFEELHSKCSNFSSFC